FGSVPVGQSSSATTLTLTKKAGGSLAISNFGFPGASVNPGDFFSIKGATCTTTTTLAAGESCTARAVFQPTATGARSGLFRFYLNVQNGYVDTPLYGTGAAPTLQSASARRSSVLFGSVPVGQSSSATTL